MILFLELLDLVDVVDKVLHLVEDRDGFSGDDIPKIFFDLHG